MTLIAETTNGYFFSNDAMIEEQTVKSDNSKSIVPEDFSRKVCIKLLDEAYFVIKSYNFYNIVWYY